MLTVSVAFLGSFPFFLFKYQYFSTLQVFEHCCIDCSSFKVRFSNQDLSVLILEQYLIKVNAFSFFNLKPVNKNLPAFFHLELLSGNVYNCVHNKNFL